MKINCFNSACNFKRGQWQVCDIFVTVSLLELWAVLFAINVVESVIRIAIEFSLMNGAFY